VLVSDVLTTRHHPAVSLGPHVLWLSLQSAVPAGVLGLGSQSQAITNRRTTSGCLSSCLFRRRGLASVGRYNDVDHVTNVTMCITSITSITTMCITTMCITTTIMSRLHRFCCTQTQTQTQAHHAMSRSYYSFPNSNALNLDPEARV